MIGWPQKDPNAYVDYRIDWEPTLEINTDTIQTSIWSADPGITINNEFINGFQTGIWAGGGTDGKLYEIQNTVQTTGGRTYVVSFKIFVKKQVCVAVPV